MDYFLPLKNQTNKRLKNDCWQRQRYQYRPLLLHKATALIEPTSTCLFSENQPSPSFKEQNIAFPLETLSSEGVLA